MSMTFSGMIDQAQQHLRSVVRDQELATWLKFPLSSTGLEVFVNDASVVSRGRIEIGSELIVVEDVDLARNALIVPPYGRGSDGTTAAAHAANAKVTVQPLYPRKIVADALNNTIRSVSERLFGVQTVELTASPTRVSYELPAETAKVLGVKYQYDYISKSMVYARDWTFDQQAEWDSGKGILIYDYPRPGDPIYVITAVDAQTMEEGDDYSVSLLPASSWDVIVYGAVARLIVTAGTYMTATRAIGAQTTLGAGMDPITPLQLSRHFQSLHMQRLEEEVQRLYGTYSNRAHYQRRG